MDSTVTLTKPGSKAKIVLDYSQIKKAAMVLRAVNHGLRQSIIKLLEKKQDMVVTDIYVKLRIEQSVASQHLAILRKAGVVDTKRDGKFIHYSLNKARLEEISGFVDDLVE
ncbi:MAG: metalloregulator ArsR/SmtB family transcription factor [Saprospiraceae bacterium]|nr:metalloregulator ArsR/SmtB family transcription factor [Saprospiraceae bacterium]